MATVNRLEDGEELPFEDGERPFRDEVGVTDDIIEHAVKLIVKEKTPKEDYIIEEYMGEASAPAATFENLFGDVNTLIKKNFKEKVKFLDDCDVTPNAIVLWHMLCGLSFEPEEAGEDLEIAPFLTAMGAVFKRSGPILASLMFGMTDDKVL